MADFNFKKIFDPAGTYGDAYEDVTRWGANGHRFQFTGKRGPRRQLSTVAYFFDKTSADTGKSDLEAAKGTQKTIQNDLDGYTETVFIHEVLALPPKKVEVAGLSGVSYQLRATIEVTVVA